MRLLFLLLVVPLVYGDRTVTTNSGPVRGVPVPGKKVEAFLGIPFAEPPVGELRFAKPVPKSPWKETLEANKLSAVCIQADVEKLHFPFSTEHLQMSEDCLYLNVWVPEGGKDLKPIMLWIHGGGFMCGTANMENYDGAKLAEHGDVIVVSINYRVGTLGFFTALTDEAPGSAGMYDQVLAIQWVKDNAKHFGGDPDNIVLFGESAGGFSVSLHMVSPLSKNLFKRSILQSGAGVHPMYSNDNKAVLAGSLAAAATVGCASDQESLKNNPKEVIDCLKSLPAEKFREADKFVSKNVGMLVPRVGNDFLPENPTDLYRQGSFKRDEVLMGITRDEGSILLTLSQPEIFGVFGEKVGPNTFDEATIKKMIRILTTGLGQDEILQTYYDRVKESSRYSYLHAMRDIVGDTLIACPAVFQADFQSLKDVPVYFYLFDYRPAATTLAEWMGVAHFDELQYVFGVPMYEQGFTEFEKEFSNDIMDMFVNFVKTGNPNIPGEVKWPRYSYEDPKYYVISQRDGLGVKPDNDRCEAWRSVYRSVIDEAPKRS